MVKRGGNGREGKRRGTLSLVLMFAGQEMMRGGVDGKDRGRAKKHNCTLGNDR